MQDSSTPDLVDDLVVFAELTVGEQLDLDGAVAGGLDQRLEHRGHGAGMALERIFRVEMTDADGDVGGLRGKRHHQGGRAEGRGLEEHG
jgi:hypothetical protein